jgi:uncharacterized membrane protein
MKIAIVNTEKINKSATVSWYFAVTALIFFACSSIRHILFQSSAYDLGIFDQAVYLISQGQSPISSFMGYHILGDHAAWIWYPISLLYKIYPSVYWLFAIQAIALASGAFPTYSLATQSGLKESQANAIVIVYLLHPLLFNVNLFDFHPEVMALPAHLAAVWSVRQGKTKWFCASVIFILGCKAVLSLTVAAMGVWLILFEKRRWYGGFAFLTGIVWFAVATFFIIPSFSGQEAAAVGRYSYLGNSVLEIAKNLLFRPEPLLKVVFSLDNLFYLILLFLPLIWGLSLPHLTPLVAAIPCIALNLLADYHSQKDLVNHYSLPAFPFLLLAVISSLAAGKAWISSKKFIILWSLVIFLALSKYSYFWSIYLDSLDTWQATREAIALVQTKGNVYTTAEIASHLTHRPIIKLTAANSPPDDLTQFDYILLNIRHPGWLSNPQFASQLVDQLRNTRPFQLQYQQSDVYLFTK